MNLIVKRENFFLQCENIADKIEAPVIIVSSGYTSTIMAQTAEPWLITQAKTLPVKNRDTLPDPFIINTSCNCICSQVDCALYRLYLTPECKSLKNASVELADLLENQIFKQCESCFLIGHSKGGLLFSSVAEKLITSTNIVLVAPTYGCIFGDESSFVKALERQSEGLLKSLDKLLFETTMKKVGSRRPVDHDMSIGSDFVNTLDFRALKNHNVLLIPARCPDKKFCNPVDAFFRHYGKYIGLDVEGDGMVRYSNQMMPVTYYDFIKKVHPIEATHPRALFVALPIITEFIANTLK